jgi:hypothetical protein
MLIHSLTSLCTLRAFIICTYSFLLSLSSSTANPLSAWLSYCSTYSMMPAPLPGFGNYCSGFLHHTLDFFLFSSSSLTLIPGTVLFKHSTLLSLSYSIFYLTLYSISSVSPAPSVRLLSLYPQKYTIRAASLMSYPFSFLRLLTNSHNCSVSSISCLQNPIAVCISRSAHSHALPSFPNIT